MGVKILVYLDAAGHSPYRTGLTASILRLPPRCDRHHPDRAWQPFQSERSRLGRPGVPGRLRAGVPDLFRQRRRPLGDSLGRGTKRRQDKDVALAQARWTDYKKRKNKN